MCNKKRICSTCRDFVIQGYSDNVDDIGLHNEQQQAVADAIPEGSIDQSGLIIRDAFEACDVCALTVDTLFVFDVSAKVHREVAQ